MKFQVFLNCTSNAVHAALTSSELADVIRVGGGVHGIPDYTQAMIDLRNENDSVKQTQIKTTRIPAFVPSVFYDNNSKASGSTFKIQPYLVLDIDGKDNPHLKTANPGLSMRLPGELVFTSPRGGRKVLIPVKLRNENDYPAAYALLTQLVNKALVKLDEQELKFDKQAAKYSQLCLLSWDKNVVYGDEYEPVAPNYGGLLATAPRAVFSGLSEKDWTNVDTSSVAALFGSVVSKMTTVGKGWGSGTDAFLTDIVRLKLHGVGLPELLQLTHTHANGVYSKGTPKNEVTDKLTRFYNGRYTNMKPAVVPGAGAGNSFVFDKYLTEHLPAVWAQLQSKGNIYIDAPTGAGKTTLIKALATLSNLSIDLLCPTTALAEQQHGEGVSHITGTGGLNASHYAAPVLACPYESLGKVKQRQAEILVIDEAHELVSAYNYRSKSIQNISDYICSYKYVIFLSGSMFPIINGSNTDNILTFTRKVPVKIPYNVVTLAKKEKDADYFATTLKDNSLNVFYKNDKQLLIALKEYFTSIGKVALLVSSDNKEDDGYRKMIDDSTLMKYDIVLTTCLLQSGVNVTDTRPVNIVFGMGCNVLDYIQFTARFRAVVPTVEIIHSNQIGALFAFNEVNTRQGIEATITGLNNANQINKKLIMNEKSYLRPADIDGTRIDENGNYQIDEYYIQYKKHEVFNSNCRNNINFLKDCLGSFGFDFQQHIDTGAAAVIGETEQRVKALTKQRRETIASGLIAATYSRNKASGKEEREIIHRFDRLHALEIGCLTVAMLTNNKEYDRTLKRALYEHFTANKTSGHALSDKAELWYGKLDSIKQQVSPGIIGADTLKNIVTMAIGKPAYDQQVNDVVSVIFDLQRKRVRTGNGRAYEYQIQHRQAANLTKSVGSVSVPDDFFN